MNTLELEIHAASQLEGLEKAVSFMRDHYGLSSTFTLKVLVLLIMEAKDRKLVISSRRVFQDKLGCTRQQFQNALTRLRRKGLIAQVQTNHYLLAPVVPVPGVGGVTLNIKIHTNDANDIE